MHQDKEIWPNWKNRTKLQKKNYVVRTDNLSDAQFKTLVIWMFTEMVEYGRKMEEEMKAVQNEMYREPTVMGRKLGLQSMG